MPIRVNMKNMSICKSQCIFRMLLHVQPQAAFCQCCLLQTKVKCRVNKDLFVVLVTEMSQNDRDILDFRRSAIRVVKLLTVSNSCGLQQGLSRTSYSTHRFTVAYTVSYIVAFRFEIKYADVFLLVTLMSIVSFEANEIDFKLRFRLLNKRTAAIAYRRKLH